MYLLLKSKKATIKGHPVIKRLYQYRQLLAQTDPIFEEQIHPQMALLLEIANKTQPSDRKINPKKKMLSILKTAQKCGNANEASENGVKRKHSLIQQSSKERHITFARNLVNQQGNEDLSSESEHEQPELDAENNEKKEIESGESSKRAINYQIAKNKGLTPRRKKEQRNPRVKHRNKFRKAKTRRKGAVREVRREISRYGGEISGIKASVSKSIKFKS